MARNLQHELVLYLIYSSMSQGIGCYNRQELTECITIHQRGSDNQVKEMMWRLFYFNIYFKNESHVKVGHILQFA